ncbi:hypothetical protein LPJ64_002419 [Coemansia asiatica]|uniref:RNB domain-containing protein n=1 Tax=Coemansia asiatica TaxID=1052880 RepID=A0A9W8CKZ1_9FUNG|nr:hypothetical protein LPJ64_002419 [Coemansia asiatica]
MDHPKTESASAPGQIAANGSRKHHKPQQQHPSTSRTRTRTHRRSSASGQTADACLLGHAMPVPASAAAPEPKSKPKPKQRHAHHRQTANAITANPDSERQIKTPGKTRRKKPATSASLEPSAAETGTHPPSLPSIYAAYVDADQLAAGFASGQLVRGVLRSNPKNRSDAYVSLDETPSAAAVRRYPQLAEFDVGSGNDIYVCGDIDRNRAINGDIVAVRILNKAQARNSYRMHRMMEDKHHDDMRAQRRARLEHMASRLGSNTSSDATTPPGSAASTGSFSADTQDSSKSRMPELFGAVAAVLRANDDRCFTGTINTSPPSSVKKHATFVRSLDPSTLWFKPLNQALPFMALAASDVPKRLFASKSKRCCTVRLLKWEICDPVPTACFVSDLGKRGPLDIETRLILEENGVCTEPFSPAVLRCLPQTPWRIPARELRRRTDLRRACIFTIDPPTARDLDDAVSCEPLPNGNVLVGVHIADVSYFVRPDTALDLEARQRATTTYMVQKAIPMLPAMLCEDLCSLNAGVDRLAFSVMWEMDPNSATVLSTWFGRTVINSACKLSYDDAQKVIDGAYLPEDISCFQLSRSNKPVPATDSRKRQIEQCIRWFYHLSVIMRNRRFASGALSLSSIKLSFELDDAGNPKSCKPYPIKDSNRLIEEFMLLANMSVAARIEASFPDASLLRRHSPPLARRLDETCEQLRHSGIDIDSSSSCSIQASLNNIDDPDIRFTVESILTAPMQRAAYFSTHAINDKSGYAHYALNVPLYTHFTSPIRRYADVIVHRTLEASLAKDGCHLSSAHPLLPKRWSQFFPRTPATGSLTHGGGGSIGSSSSFGLELVPQSSEISKIAHRCNLRKDAAKKAQDASLKLFAVSYLAQTTRRAGTSGIFTGAVVTKIRQDCFVVVLPMFGIESTIFMDRMADRHNQVQSTDSREWKLDMWLVDPAALTLYWKADSSSSGSCNLVEQMAALAITSHGHSKIGLALHSSSEHIQQTIRVFDKVTVYVEPTLNLPDLSVKLAMPRIDYLI